MAYLNYSGKANDWFFDTFLFLALRSPNNHCFYPGFASQPSNKKDWLWWLDKLFKKDEQLDALNRCVEMYKMVLKDKEVHPTLV